MHQRMRSAPLRPCRLNAERLENTTPKPADSRGNRWFGRRQTHADVIQIRWPDNTRQAEFGQAAAQVVRIEESNRKPTSCPILFAWDGNRFGFITDFLGAGSLGERQPDGTCRPPRPEESVKIEPQQLRPRDGKYVLKFSEPMDEVTYLDRLQLVVLDHPTDVRVYPDERLATADPGPTQELLAFRSEIFPVRAHDHRGRDLTKTLHKRDRITASDFARRSWMGFAEEHWVELDFGDRLSQFGPKDRLIFALPAGPITPTPNRSGRGTSRVAMQPRARAQENGRWEVLAEMAFRGMPRMTTFEVTGKLTGPQCVCAADQSGSLVGPDLCRPVLETAAAAANQPEAFGVS